MAVSLRLSRKGSRRRPFYHLLAIDSRKKRSGLYLEQVGTYDPLGATALHIDQEAAQRWIARGAQPSPTVARLLRRHAATIAAAPQDSTAATVAP